MVEERFANFQWSASTEWQDHLRNIFPVPSIPQIVRIKRKWFRQHVDSSLPLDPVAAASSPPPPQAAAQEPQRRSDRTRPSMNWLPALLFLLWPCAFIYGKGMHVAITAFVAGVISKYGLPQLNLVYWQPVFQDDDMHSVVYCVFMLILSDGFALLFPIALGAICWIISASQTVSFVPKRVKEWMGSWNIYTLALLKSDCEVALGCYMILAVLTPGGSIIAVLVYWQFLRMKYMLSNLTKASFSKLTTYGDSATARVSILQSPWGQLKRLGRFMSSMEQGQQSSCSVM